MARQKPISRRARRDLHSVALREDFNRARELRRDKDDQKNLSVSIMDMDSAIMYYFNEVIRPDVKENKETVKVPVLYASPERWVSIQKRGFMRDKRQQLIVPAIVFKRTSVERNENIPVDKLDANNPKNFMTFQQKYSQSNRYDQFSRTVGVSPNKEYFNVVIPDYVILSYEFTIWTSYIDQMNKLVEKINYTDGAYWGEPGKMRFRTKIESFTDASEMDAQERLIKTTFAVQMMGYIIPEEFNNYITTKRQLTPKRLIFNIDVEKTKDQLIDAPEGGQSVSIQETQDIFSISVSNPFTMTAGTGVTLSNNGATFDGSVAISQIFSIGQDVATTADVTFAEVSANTIVLGNPTTWSSAGISGSFSVTGSLVTSGDLTVNGNTNILGTLTAQEFHTTYTSASIIYQSGSTKFGDTIDDTHERTGSMTLSGSFGLNGYEITEISNDTTLGDQSTTATVTEYAVKQYGLTLATDQSYLRKQYQKTAAAIIGTNTASFTAVTASAPSTLTATSEADFIFFINGQYMEHDALTVEQSGSQFLLQVDTGSIGYSLESDDEILSIGKFNS